jgi:dolichol-phosphate mannosyltransferase
MPSKTLIFIPTYNELENASRMCEEIHELALDADVLFIDDASPDGTGDMLESLKPRFPRLIVQHRRRKLGIGSAHFEGIQWAYDRGYERMVTMDCDFSHSPTDIPAMLEAAEECDLSVGSRWVHADSLPGWNLFRRCMTRLGHLLTKGVLGIAQDASGALRTYRLDRLPRSVFALVKSHGYEFFFESLYVLNRNAFSIREVPIRLPARTYGHSKMSTSAAWRSACYIFELWFANLRKPEQFLLEKTPPKIDPGLIDPQNWDSYWNDKSDTGGAIYETIAGIYRRGVIKPNLDAAIRGTFPVGSSLLHAGCGSGQVDTDLQREMRITALDISPGALRRYSRNNPNAVEVKHGSIFDLPFANSSFDGVYNLGVVEHFSQDEIMHILSEFCRVLRPGGKIVVFWPHARGTSVLILRMYRTLVRYFFRSSQRLHPPEISLLSSRQHAEAMLSKGSFQLVEYYFGPRDFFVQAVIVARKI